MAAPFGSTDLKSSSAFGQPNPRMIGNGLFSFDDRRGPFPKDVRPKPAIYHLLVWFQDVLAQAKTGVKKRLIILVPSVEILEQAHQSRTIKARDLCLNVRPSRL
jgi:hypothetical protein